MGITARMNRLFAPAVVVARLSEFPFPPGAQRIIRFIAENGFGHITEVEAGLLHSSGLAPQQENQLKQVAPVP